MKKKLTIIISLLALLISGVVYIDSAFELGLINKVNVLLDTEPPVIDTNHLRDQYLLNEEVSLDLTCTDNVDKTCSVQIIGEFQTHQLGNFTLTLKAVDENGNHTEYTYTYQVIEQIDTTTFIPEGYYDGIEGLRNDQLKQALHEIVSNHTEYPYTSKNDTDIWDILREADEDPNNEDNIIGFYTGLSIPKDCQDTTNPPAFCEMEAYGETKLVEWNREHIWSKSRGDFSDDKDTAHNDAHHLVAAERVMNSTKSNRFFEDCHDGDDENIEDRLYDNFTCNLWEFEPRDEIKGDVARMIFYMAIRYEDSELDLEVINDPNEDRNLKLPVYGDLDDLLKWHIQDPVSEKEIYRNETIYQYQHNVHPTQRIPH